MKDSGIEWIGEIPSKRIFYKSVMKVCLKKSGSISDIESAAKEIVSRMAVFP